MFRKPGGRAYELAVLGLIITSGTLTLLAVLFLGARPDLFPTVTARVAGIGIVLIAVSIAASHPLSVMVSLRPKDYGGREYDQMRHYGQLKAGAILLNLLAIAGLVSLAFGIAIRIREASLPTPYLLSLRVSSALAFALLLNLIYTHVHSLRIPLHRTTILPVAAFHLLAVAVTAGFGLVAIVVSNRIIRVGPLELRPEDVPLIILGGACMAAINLFVSRPLPSLLNLFSQERAPYKGRDYISKTKSIVLPASIAFALLLLIIFLLLLVGVGSTGVAGPLPIAIMGFVFLALVASVIVSVSLTRRHDTFEIYHVKSSPETRTGNLILYTSLTFAIIFFVIALLLLRGIHVPFVPSDRWVDLVAIGLLLGLGPYGFYENRRAKRVQHLEERFPDFLRDIAASHRGGLTLAASVQIAAKGEYGDLTPEIRKMADQLSWNIPFHEALERLMQRVPTPLIGRATTLIVEASRSGGNTTDVLLAAARDAREIKNLQNERRSSMSLYAIIIYLTFLVFLGVAAVIYGQFVPQLIATSEIVEQAGGVGGLTGGTPSKAEYRSFYFMAAIMQGLGNGLVGGLFQHGRIQSGLRHSFVMVLLSYIAFNFIFH